MDGGKLPAHAERSMRHHTDIHHSLADALAEMARPLPRKRGAGQTPAGRDVAVVVAVPRYPLIRLQARRIDGNSIAIVSSASGAMRDAGVAQEETSAFVREALSGSYEHVLRTTMAYVTLD